MTSEEEVLDKLGRCRDGIASALEKAQRAVDEYNTALDTHNVSGPRVPPVDDELIAAVEAANLDDKETFKQASEYIHTAVDAHAESLSNPRSRPSALGDAWDETDKTLRRALEHVKTYWQTIHAYENARQPRTSEN